MSSITHRSWLRTQLTKQFAKSTSGATGSSGRQAGAARASGGFTVVELVTAIVVMGIIIPAVSIALTNLAVVNRQARDQTLANFTAQNKIESLRSIGYNALSAGTTNFTSSLPSTFGSPKSASYTVTANTPTTGVKQVDISISYTEYSKTRNLTYRTYIGELGVGQ